MNLSNSKIFFFSCLSFIFGVFIASFFTLNSKNHLLFFLIIIIFIIILSLNIKNKKIVLISLLGIFLFLGIWRYEISFSNAKPWESNYYNGKNLTLRGYICEEPDLKKSNQKIVLCSEKISLDNNYFFDTSGEILITTNLYPSYFLKDKIEITGEIKKPENFNSFDYEKYLERYNIYSVSYYPKISILEKLKKETSFILKIKNKLQNTLNYGLAYPESGLSSAIILGNKNNISENLKTIFSQAGISHVIAISGMHISILSSLFMYFLLNIGVSRKKSFYFSTLFLIFYIILIGMPPSAVRAGTMGFLALLAINLGRLSKLPNSLVLVAFIMLLINPKLLRYDIGFQLSFLAVLGIAYFFPILENILNKILKINFLLSKEKIKKIIKIFFGILFITLSAQVFTLPILAVNFSQISLIAPFSNLFILWTLPFLIIFIIGGLILSLFLNPFTILLFFPAFIFLKYIIMVAKFSVKIPYAYIEIDYLGISWIIFYYLFLIILIFYYQKKIIAKNSFQDNFF